MPLVWLGALALAGLLLSSADAASAIGYETNRAPVAVWDALVRGSVGGGYRDNVLRTSVSPESSSFINSSAEVSLIRLSETGSQISIFLLGEDWQYADVPSVNSEQLASAMAQGSWVLSDDVEAGGELQYIYQNQVVDMSENDADLRRLLVKGNGFMGRSFWKWSVNTNWNARFDGAFTRQLYDDEEIDNYWEPEARVRVARSYGHRSEVSAAFQTARRLFDSREQADIGGYGMANTSLSYWRPEAGVQLRHYWDQKRRWRSSTKLSWLWNRDNGSGYYDYDRLLFSQQLRWANDKWEVRAGARVGWYDYRVQEVQGEKRERSYYILDIRAERRVFKHFFLYAAAEREWDISNDPLDQYQDWAASGGVGLEF